MKIIGFDLSLRSSCCCVYNSDDDFRFTMLVMKDKSFKGMDDISKDLRRMFLISKWVCDLVIGNGGGFVGIEDLAYGIRSRASSKLAGLKYVVLHELSRLECQPIMVSSSEARKLYFGSDYKMKKIYKKHDVFKAVQEKYPCLILNSDMADSFLVARFLAKTGILEENHEPACV